MLNRLGRMNRKIFLHKKREEKHPPIETASNQLSAGPGSGIQSVAFCQTNRCTYTSEE
jgi:hypothetical protein